MNTKNILKYSILATLGITILSSLLFFITVDFSNIAMVHLANWVGALLLFSFIELPFCIVYFFVKK